ncbi:MAG: ABC transporter permease [Oscillospiraceae bacterium]|nr:ABC transporter permease [Oscillospiraceae bacterium]
MGAAERVKNFLKSKTFTLLCILVAIMAFFWYFSANHSFLSVRNITSILYSMVLFILFSIGVSLLVIFGEFDLSPGYVGTAAGATLATILSGTGIPWFLVMLICLLLGIVFGLINAVLVNKFRVQSFIATLAVGSFLAKGFSYIISGGRAIAIDHPVIDWLASYKLWDVVPVTVIISVALILVYGIVLAKTQFGRSIYLCGGNKEAARLAGLDPKKLSYLLFANSGMLGAMAGVLFASRLKSGNLDGTNSYSFPAVTAVIFGGISFGGGSGNMVGCFLGLLIINAFNNGLTIMRVSPNWTGVASGALLILALTLDYLSNRRVRRQIGGKTS